ncbi:SDR family NAD(P)-dependent oxidoreductase [Streptomyces europaeiscabiei]|uniref:SDR family NAD(P)-dependent oxidoreductase n=1 Tax=Streptomyces europaeiscabiei TaxID=146819 RepID=UPI0029BC7409|nr:SDR family NAD(P)-dependent oxidoreductase [Streptomyces europaeiscabiei]MDX3695993.1 SDR family NAD(P)-dependent oxidoreductase [Streptomyces europaeiscabiei]
MNGTEPPTARRLLGKLPFVDPGRPPLPARTAFLTGASSGIGKALAAELCTRGYDVYLTARRIELLEELRAQLTDAFPQRSVTVAALDVTEHEAVARTIDDAARQFGGLGMVIANAGVDVGGNIGEGHFEAHRAVVDVNLLGAMATIDAAVAHFRSKGGGQVVGFSSVVAGAGLPGGAPYCASKAGLTRYLQSLRGELWNSGITVTTVAPGYIDTPINESLGDKRAFLIDTRTGARKIMDRIESGAVHATVPRVPWAVVEYLLARLPTRLLRKVNA